MIGVASRQNNPLCGALSNRKLDFRAWMLRLASVRAPYEFNDVAGSQAQPETGMLNRDPHLNGAGQI